MLPLRRTALVAFLLRFLMTRIMLAPMLLLLHGCLQSCMPNPFEGLLEVYEDMVVVSLLLEMFLTEDP